MVVVVVGVRLRSVAAAPAAAERVCRCRGAPVLPGDGLQGLPLLHPVLPLAPVSRRPVVGGAAACGGEAGRNVRGREEAVGGSEQTGTSGLTQHHTANELQTVWTD